jgi:hypothetical protein
MKQQEPLMTVGELIDQLSVFDRDSEVNFSGLDFYRLKNRGPKLVQVEFNQVFYRDEQGQVVIQNID